MANLNVDIVARACSRLVERRKQTLPTPGSPNDLTMLLFSEQELAAIRHMQKDCPAIPLSNTSTRMVTMDRGVPDWYVRTSMMGRARETHLFYRGESILGTGRTNRITQSKADLPYAQELYKWFSKAVEIEVENIFASKFVYQILEKRLTTPNRVTKYWPQLASMTTVPHVSTQYMGRGRTETSMAKRNDKLLDDAGTRTTTPDGWTDKHEQVIRVVSGIFAQAQILPPMEPQMTPWAWPSGVDLPSSWSVAWV
jgi:hypothetical protein